MALLLAQQRMIRLLIDELVEQREVPSGLPETKEIQTKLNGPGEPNGNRLPESARES